MTAKRKFSEGGQHVFSLEDVLEVPYVKYGMTVGKVIASTNQVTCGVVSNGWPSLAWAAHSRGWLILVILTVRNEWTERIKRIFPDVEVMSYEDESSLNLGVRVTPHIWLSDVEPARRLKLWGCEAIRQPLVVTRRRLRQ